MEDYILKIPAWQGEIVFNTEVVSFVLLWVTLAVALVYCLFGYKKPRMGTVILLGCLSAEGANYLAAYLAKNSLLQMYLWVTITFISVGMLYFLTWLYSKLTRKIRKKKATSSIYCLITALLGALVVALTVYVKVYCNISICIGIFVVLSLVGGVYGIKKSAKQKLFYTYDDLYHMEMIEGEKNA